MPVSPVAIATLTMLLAPRTVTGLVFAALLVLPAWLRAMSETLVDIRRDWRKAPGP
jgi:hypothetical protein